MPRGDRVLPTPGSMVRLVTQVYDWNGDVMDNLTPGTHAIVLESTPRPCGGAVLEVLAGGTVTHVFDDEVACA